DEVTVELNADRNMDVHVSVIDIMGRTVATPGIQSLVQGHNQMNINVAEFVSGTYFIRMKEDKAVSTIKFDKM
ncbi:MAG TPA: T9SS type A sorting domain-containing protein, partial [Saprospiraceae bacterium]